MTLEVDPGVDPSAAAKEVNRDSSNQPGGGPWRPAVGVGGWVKSTLSRRLKKSRWCCNGHGPRGRYYDSRQGARVVAKDA